MNIVFDPEKRQALAYVDNKVVGCCEYKEVGNTWNIIHTEVDLEYRGKKLARSLVLCVLSHAREIGYQIVSDCPYGKKILESEEKEKNE